MGGAARTQFKRVAVSERPCPSRRRVADPLDPEIVDAAVGGALRSGPLNEEYFEPGLLDHAAECLRRGAGIVLLQNDTPPVLRKGATVAKNSR